MTREMFMELFNLTEDSELMECIEELSEGKPINWMEEAKKQIRTLNILIND